MRRYVRERKRELGLKGGETFVPQSYRWGREGQVDWYEAWAELGGERQQLFVFCMRAMASGGSFHRAYPHHAAVLSGSARVGVPEFRRCV